MFRLAAFRAVWRWRWWWNFRWWFLLIIWIETPASDVFGLEKCHIACWMNISKFRYSLRSPLPCMECGRGLYTDTHTHKRTHEFVYMAIMELCGVAITTTRTRTAMPTMVVSCLCVPHISIESISLYPYACVCASISLYILRCRQNRRIFTQYRWIIFIAARSPIFIYRYITQYPMHTTCYTRIHGSLCTCTMGGTLVCVCLFVFVCFSFFSSNK